jgi:hypothetical protein
MSVPTPFVSPFFEEKKYRQGTGKIPKPLAIWHTLKSFALRPWPREPGGSGFPQFLPSIGRTGNAYSTRFPPLKFRPLV